MAKIIGSAGDFYRLRVARMDDSDEPDLEWRDDILYREPPRQEMQECESYALEAVTIEDEENVAVIAIYQSSGEAHAALENISEDLDELTKSEFERRYLTER